MSTVNVAAAQVRVDRLLKLLADDEQLSRCGSPEAYRDLVGLETAETILELCQVMNTAVELAGKPSIKAVHLRLNLGWLWLVVDMTGHLLGIW